MIVEKCVTFVMHDSVGVGYNCQWLIINYKCEESQPRSG